MTVVSFYANTQGKSSGKSRGYIGPSEKLITLGSYRLCDRTFLDKYQQVTHEKLDPELPQITQTCINKKLWAFNNNIRASLGGLLMLLKLNVITINLIPKLSLVCKCCQRWVVQPH